MFSARGTREQFALWGLACLALAGMGYVGAGRLSRPSPLKIESVPYRQPDGGANPKTRPSEVRAATQKAAGAEIEVDVVGEVKQPGVQRLKVDARVEDAVAAAGGLTGKADLGRVNLAARLQDEDFIIVPKRGQVPNPPIPLRGRVVGGPAPEGVVVVAPSAGGVVASGESAPHSRRGGAKAPAQPVNLNAASLEELESLPGVGPSTAQKILDYRASHGAFTSIDELRAIRGLGAKKLEKITPYVRL